MKITGSDFFNCQFEKGDKVLVRGSNGTHFETGEVTSITKILCSIALDKKQLGQVYIAKRKHSDVILIDSDVCLIVTVEAHENEFIEILKSNDINYKKVEETKFLIKANAELLFQLGKAVGSRGYSFNIY